MKAAVYDNYGAPEVVRIAELPTPVPNDNEILVKVMAVTINTADSRIRAAKFPPGFSLPARLIFGIIKPRRKVLGSTFAGVIEAVGKNVKDFRVGSQVFGMSGLKMSAHAEYVTVSENSATIEKPATLRFAEAAALPFGGTTALYYLRDLAKIKPSQSVLINGASGAVGTNLVQLAKYYGAKVTAVCSKENHELVKSLGADKAIDYKTEDFLISDEQYDVIVDAIGNLPIAKAKQRLAQNGLLLLVVAGLKDMIMPGKNVLQGTAPERKEDLEFLAKLVEEGKLKVVVEKVYKFDEIVAAYNHVDKGHKKGNVVLSMDKITLRKGI